MAHTFETLGERLALASRRRFVGRVEELERLAALMAPDASARIALVSGPGGIGKTALLEQLVASRGAADTIVRIDGDAESLEHAIVEAQVACADAGGGPCLLIADAVEKAPGLEQWLAATLLPSLSDRWRAVVSGRRLRTVWLTDPGLSALAIRLELAPLDDGEATEMLARFGVDARWRDAIAAFSGGHPLLLALAASLDDPGAALVGGLAANPDLVRVLFERLVDEAPSARHRNALTVAALARRTDEALLREVVGGEVSPLFTWLCGRSFVASDAEGVWPHDIVRDLVRVDAKWRDRPRYDAIVDGLHRDVLARLRRDRSGAALRDVVVLLTERPTPWARLMLDRRGLSLGLVRNAGRDDALELEAIVARHGGPEEVRWARFWATRGAVTEVLASDADACAAFLTTVRVDPARRDEVADDPVMAAIFRFVDDNPIRADRSVICFRQWEARAHGQAEPVANTRLFLLAARWVMATTDAAYVFSVNRDPERWRQVENHAAMQSVVGEIVIGGQRYALILHDFRVFDVMHSQRRTRR